MIGPAISKGVSKRNSNTAKTESLRLNRATGHVRMEEQTSATFKIADSNCCSVS